MNNYTVSYFINKFEAIPEEKWISSDLERNGSCCAAGHCGIRKSHIEETLGESYFMNIDCKEIKEATALAEILSSVSKYKEPYQIIWNMNDGFSSPYSDQPTPKQRILASLYDVKALQEKEQRKDITKQLAVLPVDEKVDVVLELETPLIGVN